MWIMYTKEKSHEKVNARNSNSSSSSSKEGGIKARLKKSKIRETKKSNKESLTTVLSSSVIC